MQPAPAPSTAMPLQYTQPMACLFDKMKGRKVDLTLRVTQLLPATDLHDDAAVHTFGVNDTVAMLGYDEAKAVAEVEADGMHYAATLADIDAATMPTADVLAHEWSGGCNGLYTSALARPQAFATARPTQAESVRPTYDIEEVRVATATTSMFRVDGMVRTLHPGNILDVLEDDDTGLSVIRNADRECFAMPAGFLPGLSSSMTMKYASQAGYRQYIDLTQRCTDVQKLYLVREELKAIGGHRIKVLAKGGQKLLMYRTSQDGFVWFRNGDGQSFCMAAAKVDRYMLEIDTKSQALSSSKLRQTGVPSAHLPVEQPPWEGHTHHNPAVYEAPEPSPEQTHPVFDLPRTEHGLPLPPVGYVFPLAAPTQPPICEFGHYGFASPADWTRALSLGFIEGSRGAGFGPCNAYVHLYMINYRRKFWFGRNAVDPLELAVYTGTDEFWLGKPGADGSMLDRFKSGRNYSDLPAPTEQQVEAQMNKRQGYGAQPVQISGPEPFLDQPNEQAARSLLLHACDRQSKLGYPMANSFPVDGEKPLLMRTAIHSAFVNCGFQEDLHPIMYQLAKIKGMATPWFVSRPGPQLNADGEPRWTTVNSQRGGTGVLKEVMLEDLPFMPTAIDVDEYWAQLNALHDLGAEWDQIVARMNEGTRQSTNYHQNHCHRMRPELGILPKLHSGDRSQAKIAVAVCEGKVTALTLDQLQHNCGRGRIPGLIVAGYSKDDMLPGNVRNWIDFKHEKHPTQRGRDVRTTQTFQRAQADQDRRAQVTTLQSPGYENAAVL
ncbi:hypothetical protein LTR36_005844 [Oleoguttula mirabilis]|uniref:Uncharacterized protein n=1 Tax=Oleoguttula mirabilis TaxID=1507867 RepID=A0AAV9JE87_9PEZI|nr:hypothetical protein LTR36_005844 [Oleoguttula mirabilis]